MYDAFEIEIVVKYDDHNANSFCEVFHGTVDEVKQHVADSTDVLGWHYTIYGHKAGYGVEAIIDVSKDRADYAYELYDFLNILLEKSIKYDKIKSMILTP